MYQRGLALEAGLTPQKEVLLCINSPNCQHTQGIQNVQCSHLTLLTSVGMLQRQSPNSAWMPSPALGLSNACVPETQPPAWRWQVLGDIAGTGFPPREKWLRPVMWTAEKSLCGPNSNREQSSYNLRCDLHDLLMAISRTSHLQPCSVEAGGKGRFY